jgi:hypothetical protein
MAGVAPHERLSRARAEGAEALDALSRRTGVRVHHLRAIEDGRFMDLPRGIYARAAIKSFAAAYAIDPADILAECDAHLPPLEDPIDALARVHHVRPPAPAVVPALAVAAEPADPETPSWRPFAAAALDALLVGLLLAAVTGGAAAIAGVSVAALRDSAVSLTVVGLVLASAYFAWFGGLVGTTAGALSVGVEIPDHAATAPLTLKAIEARTVGAATREARAIRGAGEWIGSRVFRPGDPRSVQRSGLAPWPLRRRDPLLGPWSSASRPAAAPPPPLHPRRG